MGDRQPSALRVMRRVRRLSQQQLANKVGCGLSTVVRCEDDPGRMRLRFIWRVAEVLDCPVQTLVSRELPFELTPQGQAQGARPEQ